MAKNVTFSNENICLTFLGLELQQKKTEWLNNFFDNKKLPELDNNVDWLKVECATKKKTQNIKSILKNPNSPNSNIVKRVKWTRNTKGGEKIDPDIMIANPNGGWSM